MIVTSNTFFNFYLLPDCVYFRDYCPPSEQPNSGQTLYEFYCIHEAQLSSDIIAQHCRNLIDELSRQLSCRGGLAHISLLQ